MMAASSGQRPALPPVAGQEDEAAGVVASIERIEAWLAIATPGAEFVYATRASLPTNSKAAAHLRALHEDGLIDLFQRRTTMPGLRNYVARRRAPIAAPPPGRPALPPPATVEIDEDGLRLMAMLRGLVRNGLPCPPDAVIARQLGLARPSQAGALLDRLVERGDVRLDRGGKTQHRIVTLAATGKRTAAIGSAG